MTADIDPAAIVVLPIVLIMIVMFLIWPGYGDDDDNQFDDEGMP